MILANLIISARLPLLVVLLALLLHTSTWYWQILGLGLLGALFLMDCFDGYVARRQGLDLSSSHAYSYHGEDVFILGSVGRPVAVNPSRTLKRRARERRWPIEYF